MDRKTIVCEDISVKVSNYVFINFIGKAKGIRLLRNYFRWHVTGPRYLTKV